MISYIPEYRMDSVVFSVVISPSKNKRTLAMMANNERSLHHQILEPVLISILQICYFVNQNPFNLFIYYYLQPFSAQIDNTFEKYYTKYFRVIHPRSYCHFLLSTLFTEFDTSMLQTLDTLSPDFFFHVLHIC